MLKSISKLKRSIFISGSIVLVASAVIWYCFDWLHGIVDAHVDYWQGNYEVKTFGLPLSPFWDYRELLEKRYGVKVHAVAGCVVTDSQIDYVRAYNWASRGYLVQKYHKDIFEECWDEAVKIDRERSRKRK